MTMHKKTQLDPDLKLRPARWTDVEAVAKLSHDTAELEGDALFVMTAGELENAWKAPEFQLDRDVFVVETREGRLVGSEEFYNQSDHCKLQADGCVDTEFRGRGIGSALLEKATERALEEMLLAPAGERVYFQSSINNKDEAGHSLFREHGYSLVRFFWRMEIQLQEAPQASFPTGVKLLPFDKETHARAVWQADNEAFRDHWDNRDLTYKKWAHRKFGNPNFDPSLWMVAWEGEEIAGFSQNRMRQGIGWIGSLAVRRPWRGKGLGTALLRQSFDEFFRRGVRTIGLGVDSENPTGATRVYEKAGMHVAGEYALYEKELRKG
jgi:mycothiol synthase